MLYKTKQEQIILVKDQVFLWYYGCYYITKVDVTEKKSIKDYNCKLSDFFMIL